MNKFKRLIAAVLSAVFLTTSGITSDFASVVSLAAEATVLNDFASVFPAGITLYSDTFPGLHVTYDARESYLIKEGKNEITLGVLLQDKELAAKSLPALNTIFGKVVLPSKEGTLTFKKTFVTGIKTKEYEELVLKTGNLSLYEMVKSLASKDAKEAVSSYTSFLLKLSEVVQYIQSEESAEETAEEVVSPKEPDTLDEDGAEEDEITPSSCDRTILIYLDGTNLETDGGSGTKNLLDLLRARMPEGIKIYVVTGGTKTWHMNDPKAYRDYAKNLLYPDKYDSDLTPAEKARIDNLAGDLRTKYGTDINGLQLWEVVSDGAVNRMVNRQTYAGQYMTDPRFFAQIVDYVAPQDPSGKYDLIIWDHGGGLDGYGSDELLEQYMEDHKGQDLSNLPDTMFSLEQMRQAIADSDYIINGGKFDFIGFDACLMGNYEVVSTLKDLSYYYIGSEELVPGGGWDYMALFTELSKNPGISTKALGEKVVNSFIDQYKSNGESTLSVIDMTGVDELDAAISNFAVLLLKELEDNQINPSIYLEIMNNAGKRAHFGNRNGYYTSNYLDLKRFITPFTSNDQGFSQELRNAGNEVLVKLDECVLSNRFLEKDVDNGGLSIYFPLAAYYERDYTKDSVVLNNTASDAIKIYNESNINKEYKQAVARFALLSVAGKMVGEEWYEPTISTGEELLNKIKNDQYFKDNWRLLYEAAEVDESDANDPTLKNFERIIADRITSSDIIVTKPDPASKDDPAMVTVNKPQSLAEGDVVEVKIELYQKDSNNELQTVGSLGNTSQYSKYKNQEGDAAVYSVDPYDMVWYLLNGQMCSMYITTAYDDGSYKGYIPVCYWTDAQSASNMNMASGESRTDYLKRAAGEGKVTTIYLNVVSDKSGENFKVVSYSSLNSGNGAVEAASTNLNNLANSYYELLGGMDNFFTVKETPTVFSLGTIYHKEQEKLSITKDYITGGDNTHIGVSYYLSDTYGNNYYIHDYNLGEGKGLDGHEKDLPVDEDGYTIDAMTWEKSLAKAEEVREAAGREAEADSENSNSTSNSLEPALTASLTKEAAPAETEKEAVTEGAELPEETDKESSVKSEELTEGTEKEISVKNEELAEGTETGAVEAEDAEVKESDVESVGDEDSREKDSEEVEEKSEEKEAEQVSDDANKKDPEQAEASIGTEAKLGADNIAQKVITDASTAQEEENSGEPSPKQEGNSGDNLPQQESSIVEALPQQDNKEIEAVPQQEDNSGESDSKQEDSSNESSQDAMVEVANPQDGMKENVGGE